MTVQISLLVAFLFISIVQVDPTTTKHGFGSGKQDYGYVDVREGAHMFWWLYYTTDTTKDPTEVPLILWLAGGPGASSTGNGNFDGIGLQDVYLNPRNNSWVNEYNVIFVDNPVGTGYSYVDDEELFCKNNKDIAIDLVNLVKGFLENKPEFRKTPFYAYGNSYGGRMATDLAKHLDIAIKDGLFECNFKAIALGNSWISPMDATMSYAKYLYETGMLTRSSRFTIANLQKHIYRAYYSGDRLDAKYQWRIMQQIILKEMDYADIAQIYKKVKYSNVPTFSYFWFKIPHQRTLERILKIDTYRSEHPRELDELMNTDVKEALGIPEDVVWGEQRVAMFNAVEDFMDPVTESVEYLLNNTDINIFICTGNMDGLIPTPSTVEWVYNLKWNGAEEFKNTPRTTVWVDSLMEAYRKTTPRLSFYWMLTSGHLSFIDSPKATKVYLEHMVKNSIENDV